MRKIKLKLKIQLYDFVLNDDGIFPKNSTFVRDKICKDKELISHLFEVIKNADLEVVHEYQNREYVLNTLYRLY